MKKNKNGFTLTELLIALGIVAILAGAIMVAIDPGGIFSSARDNQREVHVNSIYSDHRSQDNGIAIRCLLN